MEKEIPSLSNLVELYREGNLEGDKFFCRRSLLISPGYMTMEDIKAWSDFLRKVESIENKLMWDK